ncbi:MAG: hypothetical protein SFT68_00640 [Rickettsiaceae bacterium]|nr:hypothetical protein [Rickettsiaceae bacterium]
MISFKVISESSANEISKISVNEAIEKIVLIGMGASNANTQAIMSFINYSKREILYLFSLEQYEIDLLLKGATSNNTLFLAISKSGSTDEVLQILNYVLSKFPEARYFIVTSSLNSKLGNMTDKIKDATFIQYEETISGRFSILQNASLIAPYFAGGEPFTLMKQINYNDNDDVNLLIEFMDSNTKRGRNIMIISFYNKKLEGFAIWLRQIIAESLGKNGFGITPIISYGSVCEHSQMQLYQDGPDDKFYYILSQEKIEQNHNLDFALQLHSEYFISFLRKFNRPIFIEKEVNINLLPKWMKAIEKFAEMKNLNPFDQDSVEQMKSLVKQGK